VRYLSFRLQIVTGRAGYVVHALSPRGEGRAPFVPPRLPREADGLGPALWRARRHVTAQPGEEPQASPEAMGERLFEALFPGEILRLYERSLDLLAADPEAGLRLKLMLDPRDSDLAPLQALPWELLRQPGTPEFLALSRRRPIVRYLAVPRPVYAAPRPRPLRIVPVAASPSGDDLDPLDLARELRNLREAVGSAAGIEIVTPEVRTLAALRETLGARECHVIHFMGHGGSMPGQAKKVLFFEAEDGRAQPVRGSDLMNKLGDFPTVRLAVLNACESAAVPGGGPPDDAVFDPLAGVASSLVLGGLPAVVAMRSPISDEAAIAFSRALYQRLAAGDPIDAAVAEGRQAVHSADAEALEWAVPVLFMRTPSGELFPEKDILPPPRWGRRLISALVAVLLAGGLGLAIRNWQVERLVTEGASLLEHGQWAAARERFESARTLAPQSAEVLSNLAGTEEKMGDVRAAGEHYRAAQRLQPDSAEHLYNLGHFLNGRRSFAEAYDVLQKSLALDPGRVDTYGELAEAAAGRGMVGRARVLLTTALRLDPGRPALHRRLGELELNAGQAPAAIPHLMEARRRYPLGDLGQVETVALLIQAYDRLGDSSSVCHEIGEFHRLDRPGVTPWAPIVESVARQRDCRPEP